jgi:two-component system sensor histidine kinase AgrC
MIISEFVIMLLVPSIQALTAETGGMNAVDDLTQLGMFLIYLPINGALLWLASLLFVRYNARLTGRDWIFYALFPVSQMALCISLFLLMAQGISRAAVSWQGAAVLICIAADVGLYFSMRGMEQRAAIAAENAMLERQIVLQRDHRAALQEQYENVRKMRADIDDHLAAIQHMLENGKSSEAASYAAELRPKTAYQSSLGQCENPIADAFLYSRIGELRAQGVDVTAEISIPARLSISSTDLIIAFGNLLDNASEACREIENKRLSVTARIIKGYLAIETENPVPLNSDKNKPRRVQELPRGVGFHILQELADKYDGAFTYHIQNGVFHAQLALKEADV